jgi:hypothetical protein
MPIGFANGSVLFAAPTTRSVTLLLDDTGAAAIAAGATENAIRIEIKLAPKTFFRATRFLLRDRVSKEVVRGSATVVAIWHKP